MRDEKMPPPHVILISGFTAAGKTTHARLLARALRWDYLGMAEVRRFQLSDVLDEEAEWSPGVDRLRTERSTLDVEADQIMRSLIHQHTSPLVVDAWLQPWLCELAGATKIWLNSDLRSRVLKAQVSLLRSGRKPTKDIRMEVIEKDDFSVKTFRNLYSIDFGPDTDLFDLVIDNSEFISEPNIQASNRGIAEFEPVFHSAIMRLGKVSAHVS